MIPPDYNLTLYRGDTGRWQFVLWADAAKTEAVDLTGVTGVATIRDKATGGSFALSMECTVTPPNVIDMVLESEASRDLPSKGVWDLQLTWPSGDITSVLRGSVAVTQDVTYAETAARLAVVK